MLLASLLCGCTAASPDRDKAASTAETGDTQPVQPATPEPPLAPYVPRTPFPPITVTARASECPALPKRKPNPSIEIARVLRQVACAPELFALAKEELVSKLELPPVVISTFFHSALEFHFELEEQDEPLSPIELAAALGIDTPVARRDEHHSWWLGSNPKTGELDRYGPGVIAVDIQIGFQSDGAVPPGTIVPLTDEMMILNTSVRMPGHVVQLAEDVEGLTQLTTAMRILAANTAMLNEPTDVLLERLKLHGERFTAFGSVYTGDGAPVNLITLVPERTLIRADALSEALGLVGDRAPSINRKVIPWPLEVGSSRQIPWNGVVLEIQVDALEPEAADKTGPLAGAIVKQITMKPGGA
jgi:hypothetical protein